MSIWVANVPPLYVSRDPWLDVSGNDSLDKLDADGAFWRVDCCFLLAWALLVHNEYAYFSSYCLSKAIPQSEQENGCLAASEGLFGARFERPDPEPCLTTTIV